jgi:hypothetical protein
MNIHRVNFGKKSQQDRERKFPNQPKPNLTNDSTDRGSSKDRLEDFIVGLTGADPKRLKDPKFESDRQKYLCIGTSVVYTALLAGCSGGSAFFAAVKVIDLSLGFGAIWAAIILNIDRYILNSMAPKPGKQPNFFQKLLAASPRLLFSVIIGLVLSTPLTLKIFEKEINAHIEQNFIKVEKVQKQAKQNELKQVTKKVDTIEQLINELKKNKSAKQDELTKEIQGQIGSGQQGEGAAAKSIRKNIDRIESDIATEEAAKTQEQQKIQPEIDRIERKYERESKIRQDSDGFLSRFAAREEIKHQNPAAGLAINGIECLLIAIEIIPLLIKLMSRDGLYEEEVKLTQENLSNQIKREAEYNGKLQEKQQSLDYKNLDKDLQLETLFADSSQDPQSFKLLVERLELDYSLKLELRNKLLGKLIESVKQYNLSKQELDSILDVYGEDLSESDRTAYINLFAQLQKLDREDLQRVVTLFQSSKQRKAS